VPLQQGRALPRAQVPNSAGTVRETTFTTLALPVRLIKIRVWIIGVAYFHCIQLTYLTMVTPALVKCKELDKRQGRERRKKAENRE
jgi:hypothetical protein